MPLLSKTQASTTGVSSSGQQQQTHQDSTSNRESHTPDVIQGGQSSSCGLDSTPYGGNTDVHVPQHSRRENSITHLDCTLGTPPRQCNCSSARPTDASGDSIEEQMPKPHQQALLFPLPVPLALPRNQHQQQQQQVEKSYSGTTNLDGLAMSLRSQGQSQNFSRLSESRQRPPPIQTSLSLSHCQPSTQESSGAHSVEAGHPLVGVSSHSEGGSFQARTIAMRLRDHAKQMLLTPAAIETYNNSSPSQNQQPDQQQQQQPQPQHMHTPSTIVNDELEDDNRHILSFQHSSGKSFEDDLQPPLSTLTVCSPLPIDRELLNAPMRGDLPVETKRKGVVYHIMQSRDSHGKCCFDASFFTLRINDMISFSWFDKNHHIFETDRTYSHVIPGGRHSIQCETEMADNKDGSEVELTNFRGTKMCFVTLFTTPGDYYFVCSYNKRRMRLHVQVRDENAHTTLTIIFAAIGLFLIIAIIVVVVLVLAYWLQKKDLFLSRSSAVSWEQYNAVKKLQELITLYLFPWLATGILIMLVVVIAAIVRAIYFSVRSKRQGAHQRGVKTRTRRIFGMGTVVFCCGNVVLLFVAYGLQLDVTDGINNFAAQLATSLVSTLNAYSAALNDVLWVIDEAPVLLPSMSVDLSDATNIVNDIAKTINQTQHWTQFGEDMVQGMFRLLPILLFATLQIGLFASALAIGSVVIKYFKTASAVGWIFAVCIGVYACACGVVWAESKLLSMLYDSAVLLKNQPENAPQQWGIDSDSIVAQLFSYCNVNNMNVTVISEFVKDILQSINSTLDAEGQKQFSTIFDFVMVLIPETINELVNNTVYIQGNLDAVQEIIDARGNDVNTLFNAQIVPFLQVVLNVINTFKGLLNCQIIRDILSQAIPVLKKDAQSYNTGLLAFMFILFGISVPTFAFSALSAYAIGHPRKLWHEPRTGRWFCFRYSYKVHHALLLKTAAEGKRDRGFALRILSKTKPIMTHLLNVRLVCLASSVLMFFDAILFVLYNEITQTSKRSRLMRALAYLGCVQLIFLLGAALFRKLLVRWLLHIFTLVIVASCMVLSCTQAIMGFVRFGKCASFGRYIEEAQRYDQPYEVDCAVTTSGHELELAIYGTINLLNSITLFVTLLLICIHERRSKAEYQKRHYVGIFSLLEKRFPRLACIFADHLNVKRIYVGFFIVLLVLFLIVIAVVDIGSFNVAGLPQDTMSSITDGSIINVIDPSKRCNGDARFCRLSLSDYIWACAHNAHSSLEDHFIAPNHYYHIEKQLTAGIRNFMLDLWYDKINVTESDEQDVYMCHMVCVAGRRSFRSAAVVFRKFLTDYPGQVIMIILEQYVNNTDVGRVLNETGLLPFVWRTDQDPPSTNDNFVWPTLGELVDSNQRLMMFNDVKQIEKAALDGTPDWLYYAFNFQYENYFGTTSVSAWRCDIGRGWCYLPSPVLPDHDDSSSSSSSLSSQSSSSSSPSSSSSSSSWVDPDYPVKFAHDITNCTGLPGPWDNDTNMDYNILYGENPPFVRRKLSTINHMITNGVGSPIQASMANLAPSIRLSALNCSSYWNQVPNIIAFDYWSISNPLGTIHQMNKNIAKNGGKYNYRDNWKKILLNGQEP